MDAWQHQFGYCELFNTLAPLAGIYIQNKPIEFKYDNKTWMIWLWKGQYGITVAAEIGVYVYSKTYSMTVGGKTYKQKWYRSAYKGERLQMSFTLYKNNKKLFSRPAKTHWWLTGFKPGIKFAWDKLKMEITIRFLDFEMAKEFCKSYGLSKPSNNKVSFTW